MQTGSAQTTRDTAPLLYTFRRCPYAIRARMAIRSAGIAVRQEEVALKNKPQAMLDLSSKGTVPVLVDGNKVIDESLDVMLWALRQNDPDSWLATLTDEEWRQSRQLIADNDGEFKGWLDRYKYADRYPEHSEDYYRQQSERFLGKLEALLEEHTYLIRNEMTLADIAVFPFIRQFSMVDQGWFAECGYPGVRKWLGELLGLAVFVEVMQKR